MPESYGWKSSSIVLQHQRHFGDGCWNNLYGYVGMSSCRHQNNCGFLQQREPMYQYTSASLHLFSFFLLYFFRILQWIFTNSYFLFRYLLTSLNKSFLFSGYKWVQSYKARIIHVAQRSDYLQLVLCRKYDFIGQTFIAQPIFFRQGLTSIYMWRIII